MILVFVALCRFDWQFKWVDYVKVTTGVKAIPVSDWMTVKNSNQKRKKSS